MPTITDEIRSELEVKHGELVHLQNDHGEALFRYPTIEQWQRFIDEQADPDLKSRALRNLVFGMAVFPEGAEFAELIRRRPGLIQSFGNELTDEFGLERSVVRKKS